MKLKKNILIESQNLSVYLPIRKERWVEPQYYRAIYTTLSDIYDWAFLQKLLVAFIRWTNSEKSSILDAWKSPK